MMDYVDIGTRSATQGRVGKAIAHMQKGNRMTLKDADKIKEAIRNSDDFVGGSDDIIKVIDSVPEVVIDTDANTISRRQAIEALTEYGHGRAVYIGVDTAVGCIDQLPPAQPAIVPCNYVKACNEATMDKLTSAVLYLNVLEELKKHGYVLVDMREVER